ncbi:787_t:CDS:2 [Funneliformis geosporum]|uniref:15380_t:CDS:1 n=1 Tax=Funneliformis geosporum TaxID=1117311 RepID=A0A9W4SPC9_9GLOM|nr:15380_t:CDS:2 [Funneliformis geosporum]CAI2174688.1 787_t:CDS:2 [Funneliformis geosporum]
MSSGDNKTNPSGGEPIAHIGTGCSALDGVGAVPVDIKQKKEQEQQSQPQSQLKNATEYVTGPISYAYTVAKDTLGNMLGTNQTSTTNDKAQDQKSDK